MLPHFLLLVSVHSDESPERRVCGQDLACKAFLFGPSKSSLSLTVQPCLLSNPPICQNHTVNMSLRLPSHTLHPHLTHCLTSVRRDTLIVPPVGRNVNHSLCVFTGGDCFESFLFLTPASRQKCKYMPSLNRVATGGLNSLPLCLFSTHRPADQHIRQVLSSQTAEGGHHWRQKGERCIIN